MAPGRREVAGPGNGWTARPSCRRMPSRAHYQETIIHPDKEKDFAANDAGVDTETVRGEAPALDPIPEFDSLELSGEEERVRGTKLGSGFDSNATRRATSASAKVPVLQRHIETDDPVGASSVLDSGDTPGGSLQSRKGTGATSHNAARTTVQPTTIKNGTSDVLAALDIGGTSARTLPVALPLYPIRIRGG